MKSRVCFLFDDDWHDLREADREERRDKRALKWWLRRRRLKRWLKRLVGVDPDEVRF